MDLLKSRDNRCKDEVVTWKNDGPRGCWSSIHFIHQEAEGNELPFKVIVQTCYNACVSHREITERYKMEGYC